ncbi:hypothetical protein [Brevibacillus sp. FIR094]|uniref:hypothetical protein n=1 Tax=Brevibacillus sp. FIR094 TaxID=3134809 RepID=UPI003D204F82
MRWKCGCGGEKNISSLGSRLRPAGKCELPAPKGFAGKRKSGSRFVDRARLRFFCPRIPSPLGRTPQVATSGNILLWRY